MTHTLNRRGLSEERPGEEFVVLCMVHQKDKARKTEAMREMARAVLKYKPDNIIGAPLGLEGKGIEGICVQAGIVTAVFNDRDRVNELVEEIKSKKLGISVVLSGLFNDVREICKAVDLKEHTYNISLGIFGQTDQLPDEETLEITTQCGHSLVSPNLIKDIVRKIKKGKMTSSEGARLLVKPCVCGIVNPERVQRTLDRMAKQ